MRQKMKQLLGILLTLAMVVGLMPGMSLTAYADEPYASLKNTTTVVKFDDKDWYLIDFDNSTVTLLLKECVGVSQFGNNNTYSGSTVENYVNTWYTKNISANAKTAVSAGKMFLLTRKQANAIYEANANVLKCSKASGADQNYWWLCSPGYYDDSAAYVFCDNGGVDATGHVVSDTLGVRPALKLNLSSVIFSSESKEFSLKPSHPHSFTYSASGATITATCSEEGCALTDNKTTLTIAAPTMTAYGQTGEGISASATLTGLSDFNTATGNTIAENEIKYVGRGNTTYTESSTAPTAAGTYTAKITVKEKTASVDYEIAKADPTATAPTATATYGQTLANVTLTNPEGNTAGSWAWVDVGTTSVGSVGSKTFAANFTPTDTANYNSASNVDVTVTVSKAANPATVTNTASVTKGGNTVDLANNVSKNGATGEVTYAFDGAENGCSLNGSVLTSGVNTGSVKVNVTVAADDNYEALAATPITVTINDKQTQTITAADVTATYGETGKSVSATTNGDGAISYAVKDGSEDYIDVNTSTGALTIKKVGTATVTVTATETTTYAAATKDVTINISKANAVPATVTANNRTYDGTEKPLVNVTGEATGGTMNYAIGSDATTAPTEGWGTSIPTGTDAGT